ncbi:alpha/beta fold hydrolase [Natronomonas halophila]|uniref:alpha/beta fold hydrolase n=1 Tax=Natronomonas halophila TaxID=2747817 RepID=UPI0015B602FB|nr:alpha/beta fold hydrolase [Natronomonas halophila]QLD84294.1 alpha/beta fold hydrolase [Natronomonas halophila]
MNAFASADQRSIEVDGTRIRYYVDGPEEARPVVLVHGVGIDSATVSWREAFHELAEEYRVYALDLPGHGDSDPVPDDVVPDTDYYADVLGEFFEALDVLDATLVGASTGGAIALDYTFASPARVARLVLVDSYGLDDEGTGGKRRAAYVKTPLVMEAAWWRLKRSPEFTERTLRDIVHPENLDDQLVDDAVAELQRPDAGDAYRRFQRAEVGWSGFQTSFADRMDELPVPTLFVHGKDDPLVPADHAKRASDAAPVADRFFLTDCGHLPSREHPEAFTARLQAWLDRT